MASKLFFLITTLTLTSLLLLFPPSDAAEALTQATNPGSNITSPSTVCRDTPDPSYCKNVLPRRPANVYYYGRFSVRKSLSRARKFLALIDKYQRKHKSLTTAAVRALDDCRFLATQTMEYLFTSYTTVNGTTKVLPELKAEDVQTFLSAALTNEQTCLDGLKSTASAWTVRSGLSAPLADDSKLYSVSLALFAKGWLPRKKKRVRFTGNHAGTTRFRGFRNGRLPLKMSQRTRAVYESVSRRKLADGGEGDVLVSDIVIVSKDESAGNFTTIEEAVAAAPNKTDGTNGYFLIYVMEGVYEEYITIAKNKRYVMMVGDGINRTVMTGNRSVADGWTTFNSATFIVVGPNFVAVNMTFRNTAGPEKHQAVAVRVGADFSVFYSCSFEAYQDTLYTHSLRQFYRECDIYGTVDFIFGNAAVVFQNCNIHPRRPMKGQFNAITAQGRTDPNQNTGTSIHNCTIRPSDDLASSNYTVETYLGRPWKEYSRTVYLQNYMDSFINPMGWKDWDNDTILSTLYYAEFNNTGPGASTTNRVKWPGYHAINATDAANFTVSNFLLGDDWIAPVGVPYAGGLIS